MAKLGFWWAIHIVQGRACEALASAFQACPPTP